MTFDPFGDLATKGYLRNIPGLLDINALQKFEHRVFLRQLPAAVAYLQNEDDITYDAMLRTHGLLFHRVYPWAGHDRQEVLPSKHVTKGAIQFAHPVDIARAAEEGFRLARKPGGMSAQPGDVIGSLSYAHPFLDGNGRTILVVANELAARAGFSIDWPAMTKKDYLAALTREINDPHKGELDRYLQAFHRPAVTRTQATEALAGLAAIGPRTGTGGEE